MGRVRQNRAKAHDKTYVKGFNYPVKKLEDRSEYIDRFSQEKFWGHVTSGNLKVKELIKYSE